MKLGDVYHHEVVKDLADRLGVTTNDILRMVALKSKEMGIEVNDEPIKIIKRKRIELQIKKNQKKS